VCGKVSFFFFSVKGCVRMKIGSGSHSLPAPPLVRNMYLQSHAPIISAGRGATGPIDATLGDAVALDPPSGGELPVVPIDSVPVLQMHAAPRVNDGTNSTSTFTEPLAFAPNLTPNGFINVGGGRQVRYFLKELTLDPPLPVGSAKPPATWRTDQAPQPQGVDTNVDLALFSRAPVTAINALERSTELSGQITDRWSGLCDPVAPPACVLWTFCRQPLGPSAEGEGWHLIGIPESDPPGTTRHGQPPLELFVEEPERDPDDENFRSASRRCRLSRSSSRARHRDQFCERRRAAAAREEVRRFSPSPRKCRSESACRARRTFLRAQRCGTENRKDAHREIGHALRTRLRDFTRDHTARSGAQSGAVAHPQRRAGDRRRAE
jgi:hypothetical protein